MTRYRQANTPWVSVEVPAEEGASKVEVVCAGCESRAVVFLAEDVNESLALIDAEYERHGECAEFVSGGEA